MSTMRTYTEREYAQWQEGIVEGLLAGADVLDQHGHHEQAEIMRQRALLFVEKIATPLPIEAYL